MSCTTNDSSSSKMLKWRGDNSSTESDSSPNIPFKKSSSKMSRHAVKCYVPMNIENELKKTYKDSDGGRRKKCVKLGDLSCFDNDINYKSNYGYSTEEEATEYESPDEDWYYDPRSTSKWTFANDYSSINSDSNSKSTISEVTGFEIFSETSKNGK